MRRAALAVTLLVAALAPAWPAGAQDDPPVPEGRRILILSLPGLTWEDVNDADVPVLRELLDESGIANVSLRVQRMATPAGEGYATLGAGTRAVADRTDAGMAYMPHEPFGAGTAGDEMARQQGELVTGDVLSLSFARLRSRNARSDFEADLGTLGAALQEAGIDRGVIANADGDDPLASLAGPHREAALALADSDGVVPCGQVDDTILVADGFAPFGLRLGLDAVVAAFQRCSTPRSVVLVEASDLRRTDAFTTRLSAPRARAVRAAALRDADELAGRLLAELDLSRDVVVVLSPSVARGPRLGVLGIHAPEIEPGLLVSGSTRQDGFVVLADVTPTIAALAGAALDEGALEGRPVEVGSTAGSPEDRRELLEKHDAMARFRDRIITPVAATYIAAVCLLAFAAIGILGRRHRSRVLELLALSLLAVTPVTYLAPLLPFHEWGAAAYGAAIAAGALVLGFVYAHVGGSWVRPLAVAYAVVVGLLVVNIVFLGSRLHLGSVFGESAIVAGRFTGVNNLMFAQLVIGAIALAAAVAHRRRDRVGQIGVAAILGAVAFVIAAPMWGADVGGALAGIPALGLAGARLVGLRVRWRTVVVWGLAAVVLVVVFGLLDMARDSADQSHLGRLFERIRSEGFDGFWTVADRKIATNLRSVQGSVWRFMVVPVIVAVVLVAWRAPGRFGALARAVPVLKAVAPGVFAAYLLGYALNDSGIAVPGMMLAVSVPAIVYLMSRVDLDAARHMAPGMAPPRASAGPADRAVASASEQAQ